MEPTYISISLSFTSLNYFSDSFILFLIHKINHFKMKYSHSFLLLINIPIDDYTMIVFIHSTVDRPVVSS